MAWIIIISKNDYHALPVTEDNGEDISKFETLADAKKCGDIQPMCQAYGGWYLDLSTGETEEITIH